MGILESTRRFFNPGAPAIQTRQEEQGISVRSAAGMTLFPQYQMNRPIWQTGSNARYVTEGWSKSPVVFACVLALADAVATAPIVVTEDAGDGQQEPVPDHSLQRLIQRPNPSMDSAEFFQAVTVMAALSGFCVIEKERNGLGEPVNLWPLRSDWLKPIPREQSAPAWEYRVPLRNPIILEPEDVIVYTHAPDPNMGYTGTAPMAVAFRELGILNAMTDFLKAFFDKGAVPQYGIIPRQPITTQEVADAFLEKVRGKFRETNGGPMLLTGVEDIKRIGFNFDELAYPELRNLSEVNICAAFRVPAVLIGIQAGLDSSTYSNYDTAFSFFFRTTVTSMWRRLDGALTRGLVHEFDDTGKLNIEFDLSAVDALQEDETALWTRSISALSAGGISTHTFQRLVGIDPHGPDVLYQPFSVTPVSVETGSQRTALKPSAYVERSTPKQLPTGKRSARAIAYDSDEHRARWEKRLTVTERWEQKFAEALAQQMEEQRQDVLAVMTSGGRAVREIAVDDPFDKDKWVKAFKVTMKPIVSGIIREQGELSATELGVSYAFNVNDPKVIKAMEKQLQRFAEEVNDTTWDALRVSLAEGIAEGEGIGQLAERVDSVMLDRIKSSKEVIARTEVNTAANTGTQMSWEQSGVVSGKQWLAALDSRTRQDHVDAHGQVVGIHENFSVGGAVGPHPGAMGAGSQDINCRCSMVPLLDVDMEG